MLRLLLLAIVVIGLAPGTFLRTATGAHGDIAVVTITPVPERGEAGEIGPPGPLRQTGLWEITSPHGWVGGFSALVAAGPDKLIAGTDRGFLLDIDLGGATPHAVPGSFRFIGKPLRGRKEVIDLEALAHDPESGLLWAAFEKYNLIERLGPGDARRTVHPAGMHRWGENSGPETMVRLANGQFVVIAEERRRSEPPGHPALLFPEDPHTGAAPQAFRFAVGGDYDPVDATQLPDGRVLILLRHVKYTVPVRFTTAIALADPATIRPGATWHAAIIQRLPVPRLAENFEGIAFVPDPANPQRGTVWLIADDNLSVFQRSLLLRFAWDG